MPKIAFIGAGSAVFTKNLVGDVLCQPELRDATTFALMDIDADRLETARIVTDRLIAAHGAGARVVATHDRREALDGADFVVTSFQVGGYEPSTVIDFEIPKRYGLRQTIADTLGVGGIMRGLRTIPVLLDVCRDMEEVCPDALLLNYVNPMAMLCWAVAEASPIRTVGLCHSVQHTAGELAHDLGLSDVDYRVAGINHVAFFLSLSHRGEDLYPALREVDPPAGNKVRYELLRHFGHFVTESSEHFSEYSPWFIKDGREDLIDAFDVPLDEYPRRCERQIEQWRALREELEGGGAIDTARSNEYGADIIRACSGGEPFAFNGNVPNASLRAGDPSAPLLIDNLPADCCVEVPCVASADGIAPQPVGALPRQLAALMQTNVNVQGLTVEAALTGRREAVHQAAMLDPHTGAELSLGEIRSLVDDLLEAHGEWIPAFSAAGTPA